MRGHALTRSLCLPLWLTALSFCSAVAVALPQTSAKETSPLRGESVSVTLGQSAVPLFGPWKFIVGDSPTDAKTGQPLWSDPEFDDSKWETVDLTPKDGSFDPLSG